MTASDAGELAWWDLRSSRKTRTLADRDADTTRSRSARTARTAAVGIDGGIELIDSRTGEKRTRQRRPHRTPTWLLFSPDGETVVSANEDGDRDPLGRPLGDSPRRPCTGTRTPCSSSSFRRRRPDALHGERRRERDRLGPGPAAAIKRPFRFTHDRDFDRAYDGHPGRFSPDGRLIAVGLKEEGIALLDAAI